MHCMCLCMCLGTLHWGGDCSICWCKFIHTYCSTCLCLLFSLLLVQIQIQVYCTCNQKAKNKKSKANNMALYDHVMPRLRELHWLWASERITYWLAVLVYRCLHGLVPSFFTRDWGSLCDQYQPSEKTVISIDAGTDCPTKLAQLHWHLLFSSRCCMHLEQYCTICNCVTISWKRLKTELFQRSSTTSSFPRLNFFVTWPRVFFTGNDNGTSFAN